jgi:N6-adenosine-specific RNA methylase IME4
MTVNTHIEQINILPELQSLIPPLKSDEFAQLENNCIEHGITDPIIIAVWPDDNGEERTAIGDGHNRYAIAKKNGLTFNTVRREFESLDDVKDWMITHQLGRRNLTKEQMKYLRGLQYTREKNKHGGDRKTEEIKGKNFPLEKTAQRLAEQHKVSDRTIKNDEKFTEAIDRIAEVAGEDVKHKILGRDIKTTEKEVKRIANLPPEKISNVFNAIKKGETLNLKESIHKAASLDIKETPELKVGDKKYLVVYADPPWAYGNTMPNYFDGQEDHYPLMTVKQIAAMPISQITEKNAVLFLWVTSPILEESFNVVNSWGFKYKASFVWDKVKHNMGHYNSVRHELLLICVKGSCQPQVRKLFDSVQTIERSNKHSEKPSEFLDIINTIYPKGNRIELFCRDKKENWDAYGNQL